MRGNREAALFLDRDGTIIYDGEYMSDPDEIILVPGAREAIRLASRHFRLYLVSNQRGVGLGMFTIEDVEACTARMIELLDLPAPVFAGINYGTETECKPDGYRKPSPRYLLEAIERDGLDPARSWMVGDRLSDLQCGINAGLRSALVRQSAHADLPEARAYTRERGIPVFDGLPDCVAALVRASSP
jgi:D-glycero-D-manno-heptose 1,7-bisphosphate phosphatase